MKLKILVVGGGSMGRRRLRDLTYLNPQNVMLFEPDRERCNEIAAAFGIRGFTNFEEALAERPDALSVSTPPALHQPYVERAIALNLHVFAEVPFVLDADGLARIAAETASYPKVLAVSHTIRYYPPFRLIHDLLQNGDVGKPLYLEYSLGNYLPDWHPYEDYRKFYASDMRLGGAGMDMILHEISPIQWWLGRIKSVYARLTKLSSLEIHGPDNHDVLLTFENGVRGFFHHDVIERGTLGRHIRIAGEDGTLEWHQNLSSVRVYRSRDSQNREIAFSEAGDWETALQASREMTQILARQQAKAGTVPPSGDQRFTYESCYLREMRHFLEAAVGKVPFTVASVAEELRTVRVFQAIVESGEAKREIRVGDSDAH